MRTILLSIEYDGSAYCGWQVQPNGITVQEMVEQALAKVLGEFIRIHSSGRTDAGVHARAMPAHFRTNCTLPLRAFREGVNSHLPPDIVVKEVEEKPEDFHARYSAQGKWYRYTVYQGAVRSPLAARTSWHLRAALDLAAMQQAAQRLVGEHDFAAFRASNCAAQTTVRQLFEIEISAEGAFIYFDFRGSGFLKNMVRMLVGTLVEIGLGKRPVSDIEKLLALKEGLRCGRTAPAHGLCLQEVWY